MFVVLVDGRFHSAGVCSTAGDLVAMSADVIGIDMPIGLPAAGRRVADVEVKRRLGGRASTLFFAPPQAVVQAEPYAAANDLAKRRFGFGISRQSYALRDKILEIDRLEDRRLHEVHPELSFLAMAGEPLPAKRTWAGATRRRHLLLTAGIELPADLGEAGSVPVDDVLDAAAAAWTAHRIGTAEAVSIPEPPERDSEGRPMAIWF